MDRTLERSTMRKVYLRLLPFAVLSYVLAYIDRINVSFAGLTMRGDLGMSAGTFGFAVGLFYWGYFIFEVPSNVILEKVGARIWIARIMITWGILAGLTAVVTDSPEQAKFLSPEERNWLVAKIAAERRATEAVRTFTLWQALYNPKVLLLALNYIGIVTASLGMLIFIPQIIKSLGDYSNMTVGWLTMIPYTCGAIAMVVWGRISDRMNERRWKLFVGCVFSTVGLVIAGMTMGTWWALVGMSIAAMGFYGSKGPFFAMPPMFLSGAGLAAGIAWINSIGNLGGFFGPWYVGVMKDLTGSYAGGLYGLALLGLVAALVCALFLHIPNRLPSSVIGAPAE